MARLELGASELQVQRSNHSATLSPQVPTELTVADALFELLYCIYACVFFQQVNPVRSWSSQERSRPCIGFLMARICYKHIAPDFCNTYSRPGVFVASKVIQAMLGVRFQKYHSRVYRLFFPRFVLSHSSHAAFWYNTLLPSSYAIKEKVSVLPWLAFFREDRQYVELHHSTVWRTNFDSTSQ